MIVYTSQTTVHMCMVLLYILADRFIDRGFCGGLGTAPSYNKAKPKRHCYNVSSVCVLSLFMKFDMNLLIMGFWYQSGRAQQAIGRA